MDQVQRAILYLIAFILMRRGPRVRPRLGGEPPGRSHAAAAGPLTLSPLHHIDPIGTILMPLIMAFTSAPLLAWGRPVQIQPGGAHAPA